MTAPYLLIPILIVLFILYGISLLFCQLGILERNTHRKLWNFALLATFLTTAALGVLMVVQINYRMEVPWTEQVLKFHVNFGISMSVIACFHLFWHLKYYFPFLHSSREPQTPGSGTGKSLLLPLWLVPLFIGLTGVAYQTMMVRELLSLFSGNELVISIILTLWLFLTGAGAFTGNRTVKGQLTGVKGKQVISLIIALIIIPWISIPLLYLLRIQFFPPGIEVGPAAMTGLMCLVLLPFCFLGGFSFTYTIRLFRPSGLTAARAYWWESTGSAVSGLIITLVILSGLLSGYPGRWAERALHPNEEILKTHAGATGRLTVTRTGEQLNIYENGVLTSSSGNPLMIEEMAHLTLSHHPAPGSVLLIGGIGTGIQAELAKYHLERIDCVEPDPQAVRIADRLNLIDDTDGTIHYFHVPPVRHLMTSNRTYDVILVMLPGPQNLSLNRFYSNGFLSLVKQHLNPSGLLSVLLPGTANYVSEPAMKTLGPVCAAARQSFREVSVLPGENSYLIASDSLANIPILSVMAERGIQTRFIKPGYFDETLFVFRRTEINQLLDAGFPPNEEFRPAAFLGMISWWTGKFPIGILWFFGALTVLVILITLIRGKPENNAMFFMGAGASGLQVILLLLLQMAAGTLYLLTGLLLAVFMIGLASGSWIGGRYRTGPGSLLEAIPFLMFTVVCLLLLWIAPWLAKPSVITGLKAGLLFLGSFLSAVAVGAAYARMAAISGEVSGPGNLYAYDLIGAGVGALLFPLALLPLFGIKVALGVLSALGVVSLGLRKLVQEC